MTKLRIYRHPECERCRRISDTHRKLDWLHRLSFSTETPPCGPLRQGEIAVEKLATGEIFKGVKAVRLIFSQVPVYLAFYPALYIPFIASRIDKDLSGCEGDSCAITPAKKAESISAH